jgi:glycerophosphoryl diester phosphodiesterase
MAANKTGIDISQLKLMAHRGIPWTWPESSLLSFTRAINAGAEVVEFDVRLSKDGVPVLMHDATVDRTTDGTGLVSELTLAQLRERRIIFTKSGSVKSGEPIPTLEETIETFRPHPNVMIMCEIKDYSDLCIKKVVEAFRGLQHRTCYDCFDYPVLEKIKNIDSALLVHGFPLFKMTGVPDIKNAEKIFDYIGLSFKDTDEAVMERCKAAGILTSLAVVNDPEDLYRCAELGAYMVTTDRADLFCRFRKDNGLKTGAY